MNVLSGKNSFIKIMSYILLSISVLLQLYFLMITFNKMYFMLFTAISGIFVFIRAILLKKK